MAMDAVAQPIPTSATVSAVITRADGTVIDLGIVDASFDNPFRQLWWDNVGKRLSNRRIRRANRGN